MIKHSVRRLFFFFFVGIFCWYSPTDKQKKEEKAKEASYKTYISLRQYCAKVRRLHVRL
jgi:protein-S-isoprenylcysteine O-methyltransferase Ste14